MKRITNILSYLCLLLLLLVVACSDLEEIVVNMQGEEEVELTIQTNIPSLGGSTRTAPIENITSITALAFDSDHELVKVAIEDVTISPDSIPSTSGTYTVKVPVRTRRIHFIAKNNGTFDTFSTETDYGKGENELLQDLTTNELHYWGKLDFANADELKSGGDVTLIRNMAKLVLDTDSNDDYIAGLLNYNVKGTIVPYKDGVLGYQTATNHDLPTDFEIAKDEEDKLLGKEHYMFEEFNDTIDGNTDLVYAICNIDDKFYKIAFKSGDSYYYIIRNQVYTIKIAGTLDDKLGKDTYADAVQNGSPINDTTKEQVHIEFEPDGETTFAITDNEVSMYLGETGKVKVIIPEGITELQIGYFTENFNAGGLSVKTTGGEAVSTTKATETRENIYIDTYDVTNLREIELSISLKESITDAINDMQIQFVGTGELKQADNKLTVDVLKRDDIILSETAVEIPKSAGSEFTVSVTIPSFGNFDGNFELQVTDVNDKFTIAPEPQDGKYIVAENSHTEFTFTLKADGNVDDVYTINFDAISEFHHLTGTTTVTLIDDAVPDQDVYEIWVGDGNAWTGTTNSVEFFGYKTTADSNGFEKNTTPPTGFRTTFYDALAVNGTTYSADNHKQQAMVMGSDDSFTFTIPEGDNRWLTMLVAADGNNTPSINLLKGDEDYTTKTADALANGTYNFGAEGEITSAGRLIRYELPAGTYTLQRGTADYLLYYMRVSKKKPETTDVAQPQLTDYNLSWSGGAYDDINGKGYLKINDAKHIVDEDNLTHTVSLKAENSLKNSLNLTSYLSTFDLTVATTRVRFAETNSNVYNDYDSVTKDYNNNQTNSCSLDTHNAGNYTLKGTINSPEYKYSAFYDKLLLDAVQYEVKSPIMPGLYTSMDGDKLTPVNGFTNLDEAWTIGFKMPMVVPISASELLPYDANNPKYKNYTIDINIPHWTLSDEGDARGLGVIEKSTYNYTLGTQENNNSQEMIHPREGWTYKIKWASIAGESITPMLTDEDDTDHYFTYKGTIAKEVEIPTPYSETPLNITLDFYAENGVAFDNLQFGETKFYLKATIPSNIPAGKKIYLNLNTAGKDGINETQSYNQSASNGISYRYTNDVVDGLVITTVKDQTDYLMCWQYVRSDANNTNDVTITYTVSSDKHTLTNETQASITIKGNSQVVDNPLSIALDFYADEDGDGSFENQGNSFNNLLLKLTDQTVASKVWLEATVTGDLSDYYGDNVVLTGEFPAYNAQYSGWAIHWVNSKKSGAINYYGNDQNGTGLQFTIDQNNTEQVYLIEWEFVPSTNNYQGYGDIGFTYTISAYADSPVKYNLTGDTQATIEFTNEPTNAEPDNTGGTTIWTGSQQWGDWSAGDYQPNYLAINYFLPAGTEIILNVTSANGGAVEMHDCTLTSLRLTSSDVTYPVQDDNYFNVGSGNTSPKFTVPSGGVNGLRINGSNVTITSVVVKYPNKIGQIFSYDFSDGQTINGWGENGKDNVSRSIGNENGNNYLILSNTGSFAQAAIDGEYEPGNYTLTFRVRGISKGNGNMNMNMIFQHHYDPSDTNPVYDENVGNSNPNPVGFTTEWQPVEVNITLNKGANRFLINYTDFTGDIHIDDLELVRNN